MRNSTKKLVSSIIAFCMLFTTVFSNAVVVSAADYTAGTLEGLAFTTATADNVKTSTWTFAPPETSDIKISADDKLEGIVITGSNAKTWNAGNGLALSKTAGMNVPVSADVTSGTITITAKGDNTARYLMLNNNEAKSIAYSTKEVCSLDFTAEDVVGGYLCFTNAPAGGDYKMSEIKLVETLAAAADETETQTETQTESVSEVESETESVSEVESESESVSEAESESNSVEEDTQVTTDNGLETGKADLVASASATKFTKAGEKFTVTYDLKNNSGVNNATGFIQYNPNVVMLESMSVLGTATADFVSAVPNNQTGGYEYLDAGNTKTAAELGNVKVDAINKGEDGYPANIVGDATLFELSFVTVGVGSSDINFVPYGDFVDASNNKVDVAITNTNVTVADAPVANGVVTATASKAEFDAIGEEFTVDFAVAENPGFNNMTGFIEYDANVVELVSVTDGLFLGFATNAAEVPQNTVEGYEYLDANNTLTAAQLGKVKFAHTANTSGQNYDIVDNGTLFTATFKTAGKGTSNITIVPYGDVVNSTNEVIGMAFEGTSVAIADTATVLAEEIGFATVVSGVEATEGVYKVAFDGSTETKTIDVDYVISGNKSGITNATFFAEFDPEVLTPVSVKAGKLAVEADLSYVPSKTNEDYMAYGADGVKTVAELGAVKLVSEVADAAVTDETFVVCTVTYAVNKLGTTYIAGVPVLDADGHAKWGVADETANLDAMCRSIVVTPADVEFTGKLGEVTYSVELVDGATADETGKLVVAEDTKNFTVSLNVKNNTGFNAFTGYFDFDASLVKPVSVVSGSEFISAADIEAAMTYVPSATNPDFEGLGADGVKTAAELGRLVIANYDQTDAGFTSDGAIFVISFERGENGGDVTIKYTDIQTSAYVADENGGKFEDLVTVCEELVLTLAGDAAPTTVAHMLGDVVHDKVVDGKDAATVLTFARNQDNASSVTELDIANVNGDLDASGVPVVDGKDAAFVLLKARSAENYFNAIEGGRTDITLDGTNEYIQIAADYACGCPVA